MQNNQQKYPQLNLPATRLQVKVCDDGITRVFDRLRQKFVALTPEEWVRQHFTANMIENLGYPAALMGNEVMITLNGTMRRCDTVVYAHTGLTPLMIVEYKAPHVAITQRVFDQIFRYNMVLNVRWLVVSNGLSHYCCEINYKERNYKFLPSIPTYAEIK